MTPQLTGKNKPHMPESSSSVCIPKRCIPWPAAGLLLVAITFSAYFPALGGGYIWDDDDYVTANDTLRSVQGLGRIWGEIGATPQYYPMVHTSYWLEYHLWGLNPAGYHLVNVLLHATSAMLLWRLLARLGLPGAWAAAAIFAVHPVHVESVAWITERKNVLSGVFYLSALLAYLRFGFEPGETTPRNTRRRWYGLSLLLFLAALLSKTVAGSLPAAVLLILWWKRGRIRWVDVYPLVPFFVLAIALGLLTATMEKHHVGAQGGEWNFSPADRCLIAGRALWFYAGKLVWPTYLTFIYPRWQIDSGSWWQYLFPGMALAVIAVLWLLGRRIGRGPLAAVLFFAGTLVPALGFFNVYPMRYSFVADHFQYLASLGLIVLAVGAGAQAVTGRGTRGRQAGVAFVACLVVVLGALTWRQGHVYANLQTLWRDTLTKNPAAWLAHNNLGLILSENGNVDEAIAHLDEALRLFPDYVEAHNNLGIALAGQGRTDEAIRHYTRALQLQPNHPEVHTNLGAALARQGSIEDAIAHHTKALRLQPKLAEAYNNRGNAYGKMGDFARAITDCTKAIELKKDYLDAYNSRGHAYVALGQYERAIGDYSKVIELRPDRAEAYNDRGHAWDSLHDYDRAIQDYSKVIELKPGYVPAYCNRGIAYGAKGDYERALRDQSKAIELKPDFADSYNNRAVTYYTLKEYDTSRADVKTCRELGGTPNPDLLKRLAEIGEGTQ